MEVTTESKKTKAVAKVTPKAVPKADLKQAEKRLQTARTCYGEMQRNWFLFAKGLKEMRDHHDHDIFGVESFQKLCEREFALTSYSTISKFIQIVEKLGDQIETRMKKDTYILPGYETCYQLASVEDKVKSEEYSKLKKQILDEKITVAAFRDKLKDLIGKIKRKARAEIEAETDAYMEKTQRELSEELRKDPAWDEDEGRLMDSDDEDFEPEEDEDEEDDVEVRKVGAGEATVIGLKSRVQYLIENLPEYVSQLEAVDGSAKSLVKELKKLGTIIDDVVTTIEEGE